DARQAAEAEAHLDQILEIAAQLHTFGDLGVAWRAEVAAQRARFYGEDARDLFDDAVRAWDTVGRPYDAALCRLRLAEPDRDRGDRLAAAEKLEAVTSTARPLGAQPLQAAADALADRAGIRRAVDPGGPAGILTKREHEVLVLLADGHSNIQIAADL